MSDSLIVVGMRAAGVLVVLWAIYRAFRGSFQSENNIGLTETLNRSRDPFRFWGSLAVQAAVGLALIFLPIQL